MVRTTLVEHSIDTGNHLPFRQGLRRHPMAHLEVIVSRLPLDAMRGSLTT